MKTIFLIAAAAWLALSAAPSQADPPKIRVGWIVTPAQITPYMFMKDGIARHNGTSYTLEPVHFQGSPLEITAAQAGDLNVIAFGSTSFAIAVENAGLNDLRIIADEVQDGVPGWAGPELRVLKDGPIKSVADLRGKVLATNGFGGATDIAIKMMMLKNGMAQNRDYTEIEAAMPNMNALLLEHKADLVTAVHPFQDNPDFNAKSHVLFRSSDILGKFELSFWTARTNYIASRRAILTDLLEDYVRARRWYLDPANRTEAIAIVANFTKLPARNFENWLFTSKDEFRDPDALPDVDAITRNIHAQHDVGLIKADLDASRYVDLGMLKDALARAK